MKTEVVDRAIDFIVANPERHFQGSWATKSACGTTMCVAGTIVWQAGYEMLYYSSIDANDSCAYAQYCVDSDGHTFDIEELATRLAELPEDVSRRLFYNSRASAEDMALMWKQIKEEMGVAAR